MKLYNTLTRQVEEIEALQPPSVTVYTCGPTVYDYPHIGNWFSFIRYDMLIRTLKASGFAPQWVLNITDVGHLVSDADEGEDKLEKGAKREGKNAWDVAKFYTDYFLQGLKRLNFTQPDFLPKATEHIHEQIDLIKRLEEKGYTYVINDGVYYDTSKFEGYTAFARLDLDDLQAGARIAVNPEKRSPNDFALWKFSPKDHQRDMEWDSPWGKGFPGWHIECSAMALKYLGETIDIHAGGIDHVPVHHTNEIAQSEAATGKRFANYWMHINHILLDHEKISKSLGNAITLEEVEKHGFSLEAFRLLVLESHYRSQSKFSWEALAASQHRLQNWRSFAVLRFQLAHNQPGFQFDESLEQIKKELAGDLNTPQAITALEASMAQVEQAYMHGENISFEAFTKFLETVDGLFGLKLAEVGEINGEQRQLINQRETARQQQDFAKADELRQQLEAEGIGLRDTELGPIWFRL